MPANPLDRLTLSPDPLYSTPYSQLENNAPSMSTPAAVLQSEQEVAGRRPVATVAARPRAGGGRGRAKRPAPYRHVPHKDKPPQLVARRNARERRRVQAVNAAFVKLRLAVPGDTAASRGKRISKVKTLQRAIDYIYLLQDLLNSDQQQGGCGDQENRVTQSYSVPERLNESCETSTGVQSFHDRSSGSDYWSTSEAKSEDLEAFLLRDLENHLSTERRTLPVSGY